MRSFKEFKEAYKGSLKSMDTEETIDLMFYRPIGFAWALLAAKFGITPNMITIASIFLGVAGGFPRNCFKKSEVLSSAFPLSVQKPT